MLLASKSMVEISGLKARLASTFDMKDLGETKLILGMEIHRDGKNVSCSYQKRSIGRKYFK